jgi:hypothetical protein
MTITERCDWATTLFGDCSYEEAKVRVESLQGQLARHGIELNISISQESRPMELPSVLNGPVPDPTTFVISSFIQPKEPPK